MDDCIEIYSYRIDRCGFITDLSDNWNSFAADNGGGKEVANSRIIGTKLMQHISGIEAKLIYEAIIDNVITHQREAIIPFRCDSPGQRRFLDLRIRPTDEGAVEFESRIKSQEVRELAPLLDSEINRSDDILVICSFCKDVKIDDDTWVEVEVAARKLKLFTRSRSLPMLSHGMCPDCYEIAMREIDQVS